MEITDNADLHALYGTPSIRAQKKQLDKLDRHARLLIAHSPFLVLGSSSPKGGTDVSPRGDLPGFVRVLDDRTLLIPDRPGNKRVDTMGNILDNPQVGMIFLVPGMDETLRVNGRARITTDPEMLEASSVQGRAPKSGLLVEVDEVFLHCPKALVRSHLWNPEHHVDRSRFPSLGQMLADQIEGVDAGEADSQLEHDIKEKLY